MAVPHFFNSKESLLIVDGTSILFRNFALSSSVYVNKYGQDIGALQGTVSSLNALCKEYQPHHMVVVFDPKGGSFRNEIYKDYKANRGQAHNQLINQIQITQELVKALGYNTLIVPGYEADDIIGTIARHNSDLGRKVVIESGDKDFIQLINDNTVLTYRRGSERYVYDMFTGADRFGVPIKYTIDYLALVGDSADNIPGIKGIGAKKAEALINGLGGIEEIYQHLDTVGFSEKFANTNPKRLTTLLEEGRENAKLSYQLATIKTDVELDNIDTADFNFNYPDVETVIGLSEVIDAYSPRDSFLNGSLYINELFIKKGYPCDGKDLEGEIEAYKKTHSKAKAYRPKRQLLQESEIEAINFVELYQNKAFEGEENPLQHLIVEQKSGKTNVQASTVDEQKVAKAKARTAKEEVIFQRRNALINKKGSKQNLDLLTCENVEVYDFFQSLKEVAGEADGWNKQLFSFANAKASSEQYLTKTKKNETITEEMLNNRGSFGYNALGRVAANLKAPLGALWLKSLAEGQEAINLSGKEDLATQINQNRQALANQALALQYPEVLNSSDAKKAEANSTTTNNEEVTSLKASLASTVEVFKEALEKVNFPNIIKEASAIDVVYHRHPKTEEPFYLSLVCSISNSAKVVRSTNGALQNSQLSISKVVEINFDLDSILAPLKGGAKELALLLLKRLILAPIFVEEVAKSRELPGEDNLVLPTLENHFVMRSSNALKTLCHDFFFTQEEVKDIVKSGLVSDTLLLAYHYYAAVKETTLGGYFAHYGELEVLNSFLAKVDEKASPLTEVPTLDRNYRLGRELESAKAGLASLAPFMGDLRRALADYATDSGNLINQESWPYLFNMEDNGVYINPYKLKVLEQKVQDLQEEVLVKLREHGAAENFNPKSPAQVARFLFDQLGLKETQGRTTSAEAIKALHHPAVDLIIEYRSLNTILSTHIVGLLKEVEESPFNVVKTTYLQTSTITGRLSSIAPNLQNVPAGGDFADPIHQCFQAPEGYKYIALDYSQIELRVLAYFSNDEAMLKSFNAGLDIHRQTASRIFDVNLEEVTKPQRQIAKAINFGLNYGKTAFSLAEELEIERREAAKYMEMYFNTYPKIKGCGEYFKDYANRCEYCFTLLDSFIPLSNMRSSIRMLVDADRRNALNYPIQGSAAQIIKKAMTVLYAQLKDNSDIRPVLQVHDELVFQVKEEAVEKAQELIQGIMEGSVSSLVEDKVYLKVESGVADYWAK